MESKSTTPQERDQSLRRIKFQFRWNVKQTSDTSVEMVVPAGQLSILNTSFMQMTDMTDRQRDRIERYALRQTALMPEPEELA
jgi:hypothetical protein